ncbi:MAG TPA: flavodoxin domain-containing protein [Thermoplasmata archaeon]|jgi:flavorubredoxin|nr:flavodoxin domain-containing protein [Thermoplasmata archaeon]
MRAHTPDLTWADDQPLRTALIVYETHYGRTREVAEHLAIGFRKEGVATDLVPIADAHRKPIETYDLLVLGCPTEHLGMTPAMHRLLKELKEQPKLKGHYGFAFDTRLRHHLKGAARHIESQMFDLGLRVPSPPASAIVESPATGAKTPPEASADSAEYRLEAGTNERFESFGSQLVRSIRGESQP